MIGKNLIKFTFILLMILTLSSFAFANVVYEDQVEIVSQMNIITTSLNYTFDDNTDLLIANDLTDIINMISPNARDGLREEIESNVQGVIYFSQSIKSYEYTEDDKIKVVGNFSAEGMNWSISGLRNNFIFEKIDGVWYLYDTDFHLKLNSDYIFKSIGLILAIVIPIFILLFIFWAWMFIDLILRKFENKILWLLLLIFLGFLGAILYFFLVRRKHKSLENNIEKIKSY